MGAARSLNEIEAQIGDNWLSMRLADRRSTNPQTDFKCRQRRRIYSVLTAAAKSDRARSWDRENGGPITAVIELTKPNDVVRMSMCLAASMRLPRRRGSARVTALAVTSFFDSHDNYAFRAAIRASIVTDCESLIWRTTLTSFVAGTLTLFIPIRRAALLISPGKFHSPTTISRPGDCAFNAL